MNSSWIPLEALQNSARFPRFRPTFSGAPRALHCPALTLTSPWTLSQTGFPWGRTQGTGKSLHREACGGSGCRAPLWSQLSKALNWSQRAQLRLTEVSPIFESELQPGPPWAPRLRGNGRLGLSGLPHAPQTCRLGPVPPFLVFILWVTLTVTAGAKWAWCLALSLHPRTRSPKPLEPPAASAGPR